MKVQAPVKPDRQYDERPQFQYLNRAGYPVCRGCGYTPSEHNDGACVMFDDRLTEGLNAEFLMSPRKRQARSGGTGKLRPLATG